MNKSLLAAAALGALTLASPAYAQRDRDRVEATDDQHRGRGENRERRERNGGRDRELLGGAQREWSPGGGGQENRIPRHDDDNGGGARRWNAPQPENHERQLPQDRRAIPLPGVEEHERGNVERGDQSQWRHNGEDGSSGVDRSHREREDWNRHNDNRGGRGEWNRDGDNHNRGGDWNRGENNRGRGDWNRDNNNHDGDWNRGAHDGRWNDDDRRRGDWDRSGWNGRTNDNRHRDWRRDHDGRDWRDWNWDRHDHRYARWRHTHRDFDRPRYRDWQHVRHGYYFDWGYAQIVSSFWGLRYYWWSYDGWRRPHRAWYVGGYLPDWVYWEPVPWDLYWRLPPPPYGCRYVVVDRDILLISLSTGIILDALLYY